MLKTHLKPESRQSGLVIQELGGEILIYDLREDKAFCLNATSALVWQACDGNKTVGEISVQTQPPIEFAGWRRFCLASFG